MKKTFLAIALCTCGLLAYAAGAVVTTTCGIQVSTVDQSAFETFGDWYDYMGDLNESLCGTRTGECIIRKDNTSLHITKICPF